MVKWFVIALALLGAYCLINSYMPSLWHEGFRVSGHLIPLAGIALGGLVFIALKAKLESPIAQR